MTLQLTQAKMFRAPPHRTADEYVRAMAGSGLWAFLARRSLTREWTEGGHHYSWTERTTPGRCIHRTALVRGDGKIQVWPTARHTAPDTPATPTTPNASERAITARDRFAHIDENGHLKGVASGTYEFE